MDSHEYNNNNNNNNNNNVRLCMGNSSETLLTNIPKQYPFSDNMQRVRRPY
jgi:hypothetical protein